VPEFLLFYFNKLVDRSETGMAKSTRTARATRRTGQWGARRPAWGGLFSAMGKKETQEAMSVNI
jgi:hypothetical protein